MRERQVLGLTGFARSGKSTAVAHLTAEHGFVAVEASGVIRNELMTEHGRSVFTREEMRKKGITMKNEFGPDFVVTRALSQPYERLVIDGIRNYTAVQTLLRNGGHMLGLVARPEVRFAREQVACDGKYPHVSVEDMIAAELPEMDSLDPNGLHMMRILRETPPDDIIDTSDIPPHIVCRNIDNVLQKYKLGRFTVRSSEL